MRSLHIVCVTSLCLASFSTSKSQAVFLDVRYPEGTLFAPSVDATAKAAINAAAADVGAAITSSLNAITNDVVIGSNGSTTATFDAYFHYKNPSTGATETISSATIAANTITMFVGTRIIAGATLGVGGPGGTVAGITAASGPTSDWVGAVADGESQLNTRYARGGGPTIGTSSGNATYGEEPADYTLDYGITVGNLWFDIDTDNDGDADTAAELQNSWHFNHTTAVQSMRDDLYSVAVHEFLHAVGYGSSNSWDELVGGTTWNGTEVQAITGSGDSLIDSDEAHLASSTMSFRLSDGMMQEVAMDPQITEGTRKEITWLDLAFLRDIGYETIESTIPGDFNADGDVDDDDLATWEDWFGVDGQADADGDMDTDVLDFLAWQRNYTGPIPLSATISAPIPEPGTALLLLMAIILCVRPRSFASCG